MKLRILSTVFTAVFLVAAYGVALRLFPLEFSDHIKTFSEENGLDAALTAALIKAESGFDKNAVSSAGAMGLMQITEPTALFCSKNMPLDLSGKPDIFDPQKNIAMGAWYLKRLLDKYRDESCALAAYNAGEGNVDKWLADPRYSSDGRTLENIPFGETDLHNQKIRWYKVIYRLLYRKELSA